MRFWHIWEFLTVRFWHFYCAFHTFSKSVTEQNLKYFVWSSSARFVCSWWILMELDFLKIAENLAAYIFEAVFMVFLLVAHQGSEISAVKNNWWCFVLRSFTKSISLHCYMPWCNWHREHFHKYAVKQKLSGWILNLDRICVDEIRLSSLTYFDRMQFYETHIKGLCSMADKAYRRFYRIFTAHLVKVSF